MANQNIPDLYYSAKDLTGQAFERLTALYPTKKRRGGSIVWRCMCDCGKECFVESCNLRSGVTRSCGCLRRGNSVTHGMTGTPIYNIWRGMIRRCGNPKCKAYKNYGGRGIKICDRWRHSFENFYADVGDPPLGKSIDRWPNMNGDYEPNNWRWATPKEQRDNSRPLSCGPAKQYWFYGHSLQGHMLIENNQQHVSRIFGLNSRHVSDCLRSKQKQHKGWKFKII